MSEIIKNASAETPSSSSAGYEVGYGKPPKATQFQPGMSGNPKGRPKAQPKTEDLILKEAARLVRVRVGDKVIHLSRREAVIRQLFQQAMEGDIKVAALLLPLLLRSEAAASLSDAASTQEGSAEVVAALADPEAMQRMLSRFAPLFQGAG